MLAERLTCEPRAQRAGRRQRPHADLISAVVGSKEGRSFRQFPLQVQGMPGPQIPFQAAGLSTGSSERQATQRSIGLCSNLGRRQVDASCLAPRERGHFRSETQAVELVADVLDRRLPLRTASRAQAIGELEQFASHALGIGKAVRAVLGHTKSDIIDNK